MCDTPDSTTVLFFFPPYEALHQEVEQLRAELTMQYLAHDELLYQECKNIEMAYMLAVGNLEYQAFQLECDVRRQKRKMECIQSKRNRCEPISIQAIDELLDLEFAAYRELLDAQVERMNAALARSHGQLLSDMETRELKKLYREIVKALHPDFHPDLTDAQKVLFYHALDAYAMGDLNGLRTIHTMISLPIAPKASSDGMTALLQEKKRLKELLQIIRDKIAAIQTSFPYTMKDFVQSPEQIAARTAELHAQIDHLQAMLVTYQTRIKELLR